jgi:hypothetical protein
MSKIDVSISYLFIVNINVRVVQEHALANWKVFVSHTMSNTWNSIYVTIVYSLQVTTFKRCTLLLNMVFSQTQQGNTGELGSQFNCFNNLASF